MYANGPGYNYTVKEDENEQHLVSRWNITQEVATGWDYTQLAAVPRNSETHGGDDVAIYANGMYMVYKKKNFIHFENVAVFSTYGKLVKFIIGLYCEGDIFQLLRGCPVEK